MLVYTLLPTYFSVASAAVAAVLSLYFLKFHAISISRAYTQAHTVKWNAKTSERRGNENIFTNLNTAAFHSHGF